MLCKKPYMKGALSFGCTQCLPCRLNRRRLWTHRLILESYKHEASSFLTLTYDKDHLPNGNSLDPEHTRNFLKRLRNNLKGRKVRYYLVGEYGDQTQRPHYHAALFGIGPTESDLIKSAWTLGHIMLGDLTPDSAQYIAGYVTKKMTSKKDPRLNGRYPEFARMSLKPGIGALAIPDLGNQLLTDPGTHIILLNKDVPSTLKHGKKSLPLGRYLKSKLRDYYGIQNETQEWKDKQKQEMQELLKSNGVSKIIAKLGGSDLKQRLLQKKNAQKILNLETKEKIYSKKGKI